MTRFPHDQFAKDFLESLLSPLGEVQTSLKVSGEVREIDVYFTPNPNEKITSDLGLLAQCAETATVFEPFRSSVKLPQIRGCMETSQSRLQILLENNRENALTVAETAEIELYEQLDTLIGFLKIRSYAALQAIPQN